MGSEKGIGRRVGILLLLQMAFALILPFVLMDALKAGYPDFLQTAASSGPQIRSGVAVGLFGSGLTIGLGIWIFPVLRSHSARAALWFVAVCVVSGAVDLVHSGAVLSMLSSSEKFTVSAGSEPAIYQAWGAAAASMRRSAHIAQLFAIGTWMASFYLSVWRFRLVARPLAVFGLIGVAGQFTGVTVMMFLGFAPIGFLAMPLAPIHLATAAWLIVKGFPSVIDADQAKG